MATEPQKISAYIAVSPITLDCPKCKAVPGTPCDVLNDFELYIWIESERLAAIDTAANKDPLKLETLRQDHPPSLLSVCLL